MKTYKFKVYFSDNAPLIISIPHPVFGTPVPLGWGRVTQIRLYTELNDSDGKELFEGDKVCIEASDEHGYVLKTTGVLGLEEGEYCVTTEDYFWPCISWTCVVSCKSLED